MTTIQAQVSEKKKQELANVKKLVSGYNVIGLIDITNLPSLQLQKLRAELKESLIVRITKKRLLNIIFNDLTKDKKNIDQLSAFMETSSPALLLTNQDPFKLAIILNKNKSAAPAKVGQIAPNDLVITSGITQFTPGPMIGELGQLGIKTKVESGKIAINEDKVIAKKGETITPKVADLLTKLGIEPMEIGFNIVAFYDNGKVYGSELFAINQDAYINSLKSLAQDAFNLALSINYINKDTITFLLSKAELEANALSNSIKFDDSKEEAKKQDTKGEPKKEELKVEEKREAPKKEEKKEITEAKNETKESKSEIKEEKQEASKESDEEVAKRILTELTDQKINQQDKSKKSTKIPSAHDLASKKDNQGG